MLDLSSDGVKDTTVTANLPRPRTWPPRTWAAKAKDLGRQGQGLGGQGQGHGRQGLGGQGEGHGGQRLDVNARIKANEFIKWMVTVTVINKTKHGGKLQMYNKVVT